MTIGQGFKTESGDLDLLINPPGLAPTRLILVKQTNKPKERSPDYLAFVDSPTGIRVGAAWRNEPRGGGAPYLSLSLESPAYHWLPDCRLEAAVFATKEGRKGQVEVVWNPPKPKDRPAENAGAGASSGDGATARSEEEDDIPF